MAVTETWWELRHTFEGFWVEEWERTHTHPKRLMACIGPMASQEIFDVIDVMIWACIDRYRDTADTRLGFPGS